MSQKVESGVDGFWTLLNANQLIKLRLSVRGAIASNELMKETRKEERNFRRRKTKFQFTES